MPPTAGSVPVAAMAAQPASRAPISGGSQRLSHGTAESTMNVSVIGPAIARLRSKARTRSSPKGRKTPATIAMTIGIGTAPITRRTTPVSPSTSIRMPVAR